jgi:tRNA(adenine34) deaminase
MINRDSYFMGQAFVEATLAFEEGEVPVGAVIVSGDQIIARGHNQVERLKDPTAHAEMIAITAAANHLGSKYLNECTLFVTLEPCPMCAGALRHARIGKIFYSAEDQKSGFMEFGGKSLLHPATNVSYGLLQENSTALLKRFFLQKRKG